MMLSEVISKARQERGLTQEELAEKVYVTRQAVSRWEMGESKPGIDMRKLIAVALHIPVSDLLELPEEPVCQCCGTPFDVPFMEYGTEADGTENTDYCQWCYKEGEFTSENQDALIERNVPFLMEATKYSQEEAVSFMGAVIPTLKRWQKIKNENISGNALRSVFYHCPSCNNICWSMGQAVVSCCGNVLEPLQATKITPTLEAHIEVTDGCHVVQVDYPMSKEDHLLFVAAVGDDLVRIKRLYPEQEATAIFPIQGPCRFFAYGKNSGLCELKKNSNK